jgi:hypothetical protein
MKRVVGWNTEARLSHQNGYTCEAQRAASGSQLLGPFVISVESWSTEAVAFCQSRCNETVKISP